MPPKKDRGGKGGRGRKKVTRPTTAKSSTRGGTAARGPARGRGRGGRLGERGGGTTQTRTTLANAVPPPPNPSLTPPPRRTTRSQQALTTMRPDPEAILRRPRGQTAAATAAAAPAAQQQPPAQETNAGETGAQDANAPREESTAPETTVAEPKDATETAEPGASGRAEAIAALRQSPTTSTPPGPRQSLPATLPSRQPSLAENPRSTRHTSTPARFSNSPDNSRTSPRGRRGSRTSAASPGRRSRHSSTASSRPGSRQASGTRGPGSPATATGPTTLTTVPEAETEGIATEGGPLESAAPAGGEASSTAAKRSPPGGADEGPMKNRKTSGEKGGDDAVGEPSSGQPGSRDVPPTIIAPPAQPNETPCERWNRLLQERCVMAEAQGPVLIDAPPLARQALDQETVGRAIASVTEAVTLNGQGTVFSLVDVVTWAFTRVGMREAGQLIARPGNEIFLVRNGNTAGEGDRHTSLYVVQNEGPNQFTLRHYDTANNHTHRGKEEPQYVASIDRALNTAGWGRQHMNRRPTTTDLGIFLGRQHAPWQCGYFATILAWARALGLDFSNFRSIRLGQQVEFDSRLQQLVELALRGLLSSEMIEAFLKCFGIVSAEAQVPESRRFDYTITFPTDYEFGNYVLRTRLEDGIPGLAAMPIMGIPNPPSAQQLIDTLEGAGVTRLRTTPTAALLHRYRDLTTGSGQTAGHPETPSGAQGQSSSSGAPQTRPAGIGEKGVATVPRSVSNPCQYVAESLNRLGETFRRDAAQDQSLNELARPARPGQRLNDDTVWRAIAAVVEAISQNNSETSFSLMDPGSFRAAINGHLAVYPIRPMARPGKAMFIPRIEGGHVSLYVLRHTGGNTFATYHYDTANDYDVHRRDMFAYGRRIGRALNEPEWTTTNRQLQITTYNSEHPARQGEGWECGFYAILFAWTHALGLPLRRFDGVSADRYTGFISQMVRLVNLGLRGYLDSETLAAFLRCYGFIENDTLVPLDRQFLRTQRFESDTALGHHITKIRLTDDIQALAAERDVQVPDVDTILADIRTDLGTVQLIQAADLLNEWIAVQESAAACAETPPPATTQGGELSSAERIQAAIDASLLSEEEDETARAIAASLEDHGGQHGGGVQASSSIAPQTATTEAPSTSPSQGASRGTGASETHNPSGIESSGQQRPSRGSSGAFRVSATGIRGPRDDSPTELDATAQQGLQPSSTLHVPSTSPAPRDRRSGAPSTESEETREWRERQHTDSGLGTSAESSDPSRPSDEVKEQQGGGDSHGDQAGSGRNAPSQQGSANGGLAEELSREWTDAQSHRPSYPGEPISNAHGPSVADVARDARALYSDAPGMPSATPTGGANSDQRPDDANGTAQGPATQGHALETEQPGTAPPVGPQPPTTLPPPGHVPFAALVGGMLESDRRQREAAQTLGSPDPEPDATSYQGLGGNAGGADYSAPSASMIDPGARRYSTVEELSSPSRRGHDSSELTGEDNSTLTVGEAEVETTGQDFIGFDNGSEESEEAEEEEGEEDPVEEEEIDEDLFEDDENDGSDANSLFDDEEEQEGGLSSTPSRPPPSCLSLPGQPLPPSTGSPDPFAMIATIDEPMPPLLPGLGLSQSLPGPSVPRPGPKRTSLQIIEEILPSRLRFYINEKRDSFGALKLTGELDEVLKDVPLEEIEKYLDAHTPGLPPTARKRTFQEYLEDMPTERQELGQYLETIPQDMKEEFIDAARYRELEAQQERLEEEPGEDEGMGEDKDVIMEDR